MKGKWALITGATAGIGEKTAWALAAKGCHLFILGRRGDRLAGLKAQLCEKFQVQVISIECDVRDQKQVDSFIQAHQESLNKLQILINNAGLARGADPLHSAKDHDLIEMIDTNVTALLMMTKKMLPFLMKNKNSHILNLGSVAGRLVYPCGSTYCATKYAVGAISEALRLDLKGTGIRVTNIEPGMVKTEFSVVRFQDQKKEDQVYEGMAPLTPEDIAETIVWCLDRPQHVNIQELVIYPTDQVAIREVHRSL